MSKFKLASGLLTAIAVPAVVVSCGSAPAEKKESTKAAPTTNPPTSTTTPANTSKWGKWTESSQYKDMETILLSMYSNKQEDISKEINNLIDGYIKAAKDWTQESHDLARENKYDKYLNERLTDIIIVFDKYKAKMKLANTQHKPLKFPSPIKSQVTYDNFASVANHIFRYGETLIEKQGENDVKMTKPEFGKLFKEIDALKTAMHNNAGSATPQTGGPKIVDSSFNEITDLVTMLHHHDAAALKTEDEFKALVLNNEVIKFDDLKTKLGVELHDIKSTTSSDWKIEATKQKGSLEVEYVISSIKKPAVKDTFTIKYVEFAIDQKIKNQILGKLSKFTLKSKFDKKELQDRLDKLQYPKSSHQNVELSVDLEYLGIDSPNIGKDIWTHLKGAPNPGGSKHSSFGDLTNDGELVGYRILINYKRYQSIEIKNARIIASDGQYAFAPKRDQKFPSDVNGLTPDRFTASTKGWPKGKKVYPAKNIDISLEIKHQTSY